MGKRRCVRGLLVGVLLAAVVGSVQAGGAVEVRFVKPEQFTDANESALERERVLALLASHLQQLGDAGLGAGCKLVVEVLDLNLAGELEPFGRAMDRVRILRDVSWPSMELHYVLSDEGGATLREGRVSLSDMNYLSHVDRYASGESLHYEKRLLDDWFKKEIATSPGH